MSETMKKNQQPEIIESSINEPDRSLTVNDMEPQGSSKEQLEINEWLKNVRFQKSLVGGVNEQDVWKKIQQLNEMYEVALKAERIRYDVLLDQVRNSRGQR